VLKNVLGIKSGCQYSLGRLLMSALGREIAKRGNE